MSVEISKLFKGFFFSNVKQTLLLFVITTNVLNTKNNYRSLVFMSLDCAG